MKKLFTLSTAAILSAATLTTQAQVTVDGQLTAAEVSATGYTLVGRDTGPRGFSPSATNEAGLLALYAAADANNLYFFLVATLQNDATPATISNSLQLFVARPGVAGVPVGTRLPKPAAVTAPAVNTSFEKFGPFLDQPGDMAIGIKGNGVAAQFQVDGVVYSGGATPTASATVLSGATGVAATGTAASVTGQTGTFTVFNGAQVAYRTAANLNSNPGYGTAGAGAVPAIGLEISVSRASIGLPAAGGAVQIFALHNNQDGGFASSDFIPQNTAALPASFTNAPNLGTDPDFRLVPGTQSATVTVGTATGVTVLGSRKAGDARIAFRAYPNPLVDNNLKLDYTVADRAQPVTITVSDMVGRAVRTISRDKAAVGQHTAQIERTGLTAGTYMVRVQVGESASARKVVIF